MEKSVPSRLSNLRELVSLLSLSVQIQAEISGILEEYERRVYALEEDNKRLLACYRDCDGKLHSLEKRYSEVLYKLQEYKNAK